MSGLGSHLRLIRHQKVSVGHGKYISVLVGDLDDPVISTKNIIPRKSTLFLTLRVALALQRWAVLLASDGRLDVATPERFPS